MKADKQYDLKINNIGYILRPGSYIKKKMPNSALQFRTGDVEYSNLTAWQYFGQSDWSGGAGKKLFSDPTKFRYSVGIKVTDEGELKLTDKPISTSFSASDHHTGLKFGANYYLGGSNGIYSYDGTTTFTQKQALTTANVYSCENFNGAMYFAVNGTTLYYSTDGTTWNTLTKSGYYLQKNHNRLYLGGDSKALYSYNGTSWTTEFTSKEWEIQGMAASQRLLLMLCKDDGNRVALRAYDGTNDFTIKEWKNMVLSSNVKNGLLHIRDNIAYFTMQSEDKNNLYIYRYDGGMVEEIYHLKVNEEFPSGITYGGLWTLETIGIAIVNEKVVITVQIDGAIDEFEIYEIDKNDNLICIETSYGDYANENVTIKSIPIAIGRDLLFTGALVSANTCYKTQRSNLDQKYRDSGSIVFSTWDMDLFSLDKWFAGLNVFNKLLPTNTSYSIQIRIDEGSWSTASTNNTANTIAIDIQFLSSNIGKKIDVRINLATTDNNSSPTIQDVVLRYILAPQMRWQWQFDLLIIDNLARRDGTLEKNSAKNLIRHLKNAIRYEDTSANTPPIIRFVDVDEEVYDIAEPGTDDKGVIFEDLEILGPFSFGAEGPEYVARCVLIEG